MFKTYIEEGQQWLVSAVLLFNRVAVGWVFLKAGYIKTTSWASTLYLFEYEYKVPLLPHQLAAYAGTAGELVLGVLVIGGVLSRGSAAALFFLNLLAYISYAHVIDTQPAGGLDHQIWGIMLLIVAVVGGGRFSVDAMAKFIANRAA